MNRWLLEVFVVLIFCFSGCSNSKNVSEVSENLQQESKQTNCQTSKTPNVGYENREQFEQKNITKFDVKIKENQNKELVFSISIDDYINAYNSYYFKDNKTNYLLSSSKWQIENLNTSVSSDYATKKYYFTEDKTLLTLPTITVYTPNGQNDIQEITLNFDWHGWTSQMYNKYETMCFYTLKVFFPELDDEQIKKLYSKINDLGYENVFTVDKQYSKDSVPCAIFYKNNIGLYPYFAMGSWQYFCIVPITSDYIDELEQKGVKTYKIE